MAMMKPIVECISQLKWLWFVRKERLLGFQAFDDASRGPTGSLVLLGKLRGFHLVSLGAAITIVAVAFGPFTQQVVTYPLSLRPNGVVTTVPQAFNYTGGTATAGLADPEIFASIVEGLSQGNLTLSAVIPTDCSTGNCTWSPYPSLGVCASVEDISSTIRNNDCNTTAFEENFEIAELINPGYPCFNYTLPEIVYGLGTADIALGLTSNATLSNGFANTSLASGFGTMQVMSLNGAVTNSSSIITAYLMYQPDLLMSINSSLRTPVAYRLNLDFCMQTYNTTMSNGIVNTTVLSNRILPIDDQSTFATNNSINVDGNSTYTSVGGNIFGSTIMGSADLAFTLQQIFGDACFDFIPSAADNSIIKTGEDTGCNFNYGIPFFNTLANSTDSSSAVKRIMENLAISVTNS